eukprot:166392-Prymnesium_polylepis.1
MRGAPRRGSRRPSPDTRADPPRRRPLNWGRESLAREWVGAGPTSSGWCEAGSAIPRTFGRTAPMSLQVPIACRCRIAKHKLRTVCFLSKLSANPHPRAFTNLTGTIPEQLTAYLELQRVGTPSCDDAVSSAPTPQPAAHPPAWNACLLRHACRDAATRAPRGDLD